MTKLRRSALVVGVASPLLLPTVLASAATAPGPSTTGGAAPGGTGGTERSVLTTEGVEVPTYGVLRQLGYQRQDQEQVILGVHGVQRVEGGTVVYLAGVRGR